MVRRNRVWSREIKRELVKSPGAGRLDERNDPAAGWQRGAG
jgi:hypothetical protein